MTKDLRDLPEPKRMEKIHLICNAHLDPVWLWEWEEGVAMAVSTFRIAADFCEQYEGFIFNHNEVILYQWVEKYEPALFKRIQRLVKEGRWHIMGGWYLQPDCNMPSGESFCRQILTGRRYFQEKFGKTPTVAINFDSFGHNLGLVQILQQAGYKGYIIFRPGQNDCALPADDFIWQGFGKSSIAVHRGYRTYASKMGKLVDKIEDYLINKVGQDVGVLPWGIGNHGGGPSREDMTKLAGYIAAHPELELVHSTPEEYFQEQAGQKVLPSFDRSLNPWGVGCYTTQIRIKQKHRLLESELYLCEKMVSSAAVLNLLPVAEIKSGIQEALCDLLLSEFHDILPGTSIPVAEESSIRLLDHGLEQVSRLKMQAFVALLSGQTPAVGQEIPIFIYNPHPYPIDWIFSYEIELAGLGSETAYTIVRISKEGEELPCQTEQESSNINLDSRKLATFRANLAPSSMNRFCCRVKTLPARPRLLCQTENGQIRIQNDQMEVIINTDTGLIDAYRVNGFDLLQAGAFSALVMSDSDDPWGMRVRSFREMAGRFSLMPPEAGSRFSGLAETVINSVRVIEQGPVRTIVEAVFQYESSFICQRYKIPAVGTEIEIEIRVFWNEKRKFLKLSVPTVMDDAKCLGQVAFGVDSLPVNGDETVAQKWVALVSQTNDRALTCINDGIYGLDCLNGELRLSLLRSPGYSSYPILALSKFMPQDRFSPHIDQGERLYRFWINGGLSQERLAQVEREAQVHHEKPYILTYFPDGSGVLPGSALILDSKTVQLSAFKPSENGDGYVIRLYESAGKPDSARLRIPVSGIDSNLSFSEFEVKTLYIRTDPASLQETDICEQSTNGQGNDYN